MSSRYQQNKIETIGLARDLAQEYRLDNLVLTLRQMYYQFVARGWEDNGQHVYKRLGTILTEARFNGNFAVGNLEDRGRSAGEGDWSTYTIDVDQAIKDCAYYVNQFPSWTLNASRWWGQPDLVSVWVEKEALSGVFDAPCRELGVPLFPCKGYPSVSTLYAWHKKVVEARRVMRNSGITPPERAVILYFGDHDPDGWEIPRSSERNLHKLQALDGEDYTIRFIRCALNMDQIREYNPPPFPAKTTSARYAGYFEEHDTDHAWELDALEPRVLRDLITEQVEAYFDEDIHAENQTLIETRREELRDRMDEVVDRAKEERT
tara:strand:- start:104 stop:1063 length:960 start_codon:yes stop_codon:yes gene_type:complete